MSLQKLIDNAPKGLNNSQIRELLNNLSVENWIDIAQNEHELVWTCIQSFNFEKLYTNDGWYKLYKVLLAKNPLRMKHVQKINHFTNGGYETRLTNEQYDELCNMSNYDLTREQNRKRNEEKLLAEQIKHFLEVLQVN